MDYHHNSYRQHRSRVQPRMQQQLSPLHRSTELNHSTSAIEPGNGTGSGSYFGTSGIGNYGGGGGDRRPRRSRSLDNRKEWFFSSDDYGFPATGTEERGTSGAVRYHSRQQQRNYDYQPYLSVSTGYGTGYRGTYDGRHGTEQYFDNLVTLQSNPTESDWDALDRSIRNYRDDPGTEQIGVTVRRTKAQSLSPVRVGGGNYGSSSKSKRYNFPTYFQRHSSTTAGATGVPQSSIPIHRSESVRRNPNDFPGSSTLQDEMEFATERGMMNYYRGGNTNQQPSEYYGAGTGPITVPNTMRGRTVIPRGTMTGTGNYGFGARKYYKFHCCCLSFRWPPWAFEEVEPPQPIYRRT
uniref:Uncharacterized protein n=1 Tax=Setaria digitata TaxID=48799 RepID=A0A915Q1N4_9BILA